MGKYEGSKGCGPVLYAHDSSCGDDDHQQVAFQNLVHCWVSYYESVLCNGHKVVNKTTGRMIPFRVIIIRMEDLKFNPDVVYSRLIEAGLEAKRGFDESLLGESPKGYIGLTVNDERRSMDELRIDATTRTQDFEDFESKVLRDIWFQRSSWVRHALHYPHSFKLASAGFTMCPWSGTYPKRFPSLELQEEEVKAEIAFNKMMGAGETVL